MRTGHAARKPSAGNPSGYCSRKKVAAALADTERTQRPPTVAGALVSTVQVTGGARFVAQATWRASAQSGQESVTWLPAVGDNVSEGSTNAAVKLKFVEGITTAWVAAPPSDQSSKL